MPQKLTSPKFAPFTLDFTFKKALASEQCKDLLLFLLNTFLERVLKEPIIDVKVIHTVHFKKMVFKRLFDIARISNFTNEELMDYESDMKRFSDHANALAYADEKGEARGVKKVARNMLAKGYSVAEVIGITNLSRGQVRALSRA